jgi:hypothetical protein
MLEGCLAHDHCPLLLVLALQAHKHTDDQQLKQDGSACIPTQHGTMSHEPDDERTASLLCPVNGMTYTTYR